MSSFGLLLLSRSGSNAMIAGNSRNVIKNPEAMPVNIIQPKSITGGIVLVTSEVNATMIVSVVNAQGSIMSLIAAPSLFRWGAAGSDTAISL